MGLWVETWFGFFSWSGLAFGPVGMLDMIDGWSFFTFTILMGGDDLFDGLVTLQYTLDQGWDFHEGELGWFG